MEEEVDVKISDLKVGVYTTIPTGITANTINDVITIDFSNLFNSGTVGVVFKTDIF